MTELDAIDIQAIAERLESATKNLVDQLQLLANQMQQNHIDNQNELDDYKCFVQRQFLEIDRRLPKPMNPPEQSAPKSTINMTREEFDAVTTRYEESIQCLGNRITELAEQTTDNHATNEAQLDRFKSYVHDELSRIDGQHPRPMNSPKR